MAPAALYEQAVRNAIADHGQTWEAPGLLASLHPDPTMTEVGMGVTTVATKKELNPKTCVPVAAAFLQKIVEQHERAQAVLLRMETQTADQTVFACVADIYGRVWWGRGKRSEPTTDVKIYHCLMGHEHGHVLTITWSLARSIGSSLFGLPSPDQECNARADDTAT
jgi:hypothetical protein